MDTGKSSYRVSGLTKRFPGVTAVDNVDMDVKESQVHGVIGRNGAGKTVLMNLISGVYQPDEGQLWIGDQEVDLSGYDPGRAHEMGVSLIPQEPEFADNLSVTDNLYMGQHVVRTGNFVRHGSMYEWVGEIIDRLNLDADPQQRMGTLPIESQQLLAFGKAVFVDESQIVLLDEITASLTMDRQQMFLDLVQRLIEDRTNLSATFISHRVNEVMNACDRVTVLRDGKVISTLDIQNTNERELANLIVGDSEQLDVSENDRDRRREIKKDTTPLLETRNLSLNGSFDNINLELYEDEVVGLAGLDGSGWESFIHTLFGLEFPDRGEIYVEGESIRIQNPSNAIQRSIAYLTKDRDKSGVIQNCSVSENILISSYDQVETFGNFLDISKANELVHKAVQKLNIKTPGLDTKIENLSGGNKQKVLINRLALAKPRIYLLNEPNRGVDIATKPEILSIIRNTLAEGSGVVMMSENEQELVEICDRIYIFFEGSIREVVHRSDPNFNISTIYKGIQGVEMN